MDQLELDDIQGYIIRGYSNLMYSRFVMLKINDVNLAKKWLGSIWKEITTAKHIPIKEELPNRSLNIGITNMGIHKLGIVLDNFNTFSPEFKEGMVTPHRSRLLGDYNDNHADNWRWGGTSNRIHIHINLMVFGIDQNECMAYYNQLKTDYESHGFEEIIFIDGQTLPDNREHFGFRDGISQPTIIGSGRTGPADNYIQPGEFILGYKNEYGVYPDSPLIMTNQGNVNLLSPDAAGSGYKDLGRNGSFMVIRQLAQDVNQFWSYMNDQTKNADGTTNEAESEKLAAKMMGRWPNGSPVTKFPDKDPGFISDDNDFGYAQNDKDALKCPYGAHLRRMNPRDNFEDNDRDESLKLTRKHRIVRRARLYGEPFVGSPSSHQPQGEVGLLFNCFNADISRQFEFLQYTWSNFPKVKELYHDPDPIIGVREVSDHQQPQHFTIQAQPVNKTIEHLPQFVTVKGGGYFFFPSISALRYLSTI